MCTDMLAKFWMLCYVVSVITVCASADTEPRCPFSGEEHQLLDRVERFVGSRLDAMYDGIAGIERHLAELVAKKQRAVDERGYKDELVDTLKEHISNLIDPFSKWRSTTEVPPLDGDPTWRLVFRATAGNGQKVYDAWTEGTGTASQRPSSMQRSCSAHFRDPALNYWTTLNVTYVRYSLFEHGQEVAFVNFNGTGSTLNSWFSGSNVLASSWCDLTSTGIYNIFSIAGYVDRTIVRRFVVNNVYNGCPEDKGHLHTIDAISQSCAMDNQPSVPQFLYSKINSADMWDRLMFGRADYMAIFIQTK